MQVISASYRTDIPAFYGEWFMRRVRAGSVKYHNPYGPQLVEVSLQPENVHAIVFWSKNYAPFLKHLDELNQRGLDHYFHYSITGYPGDPTLRPLEERVPQPEQAIRIFHALATTSSPRHVQWRYDPIIFTPLTDADWHRHTFARLARALEGMTERCYISFLDIYDKVTRNTRTLPPELQPYDPPPDEKLALAQDLAVIGEGHGIALYTCAEDFAVGGLIRRGSCVDQDILDSLWPHKRRLLKLSSNRGKCGCYDSRDIGAYDTCPHGCVYCYAVVNRPLALQRYQAHEPDLESLIRRASTQPAPPPAASSQLSLFPPETESES
jgi:hypothetical protein